MIIEYHPTVLEVLKLRKQKITPFSIFRSRMPHTDGVRVPNRWLHTNHRGSFLQNILRCYSGTTQDFETNDALFESPDIGLLKLVMKGGRAVS